MSDDGLRSCCKWFSCFSNFLFMAFWGLMIGVMAYYYNKGDYISFGEEYVLYILLSIVIWDALTIAFAFLVYCCSRNFWSCTRLFFIISLVLHLLLDIAAISVMIYARVNWSKYQDDIDKHYNNDTDFSTKTLFNWMLSIVCCETVLFFFTTCPLTMMYDKDSDSEYTQLSH